MINKAILLYSDYWEGLYVNGKLICEGSIPMNEKLSRFHYFLQLSKQHNFNLDNMNEDVLTLADEEKAVAYGCFPDVMSKFSSKYTGIVNGKASND
jgi:hypothetical protein